MIDSGSEAVALAVALEGRSKLYPADLYQPHHTGTRGPRLGLATGQRQFHESLHPIRIAAPGNGWGGTVAMAYEVDAWARHTNRWAVTPEWPVVCVWFCPEFRQLAMLMEDLTKNCFGPTPRFRESGFGGPHLEWADESKCYFASYDRDWSHLQGIPIDLAAFDEQPPRSLYNEMMQRRRAKRQSRFVCKATQTQGDDGWMKDLYHDWLKFHADQGLDEEQAMLAQLHPDLWLWPKGGIHDNPGASDKDVVWYETRRWTSDKERSVRLFGGFESWSSDPVFIADDLDWLRTQRNEWAKKNGTGLEGELEAGPEPTPG